MIKNKAKLGTIAKSKFSSLDSYKATTIRGKPIKRIAIPIHKIRKHNKTIKSRQLATNLTGIQYLQ